MERKKIYKIINTSFHFRLATFCCTSDLQMICEQQHLKNKVLEKIFRNGTSADALPLF